MRNKEPRIVFLNSMKQKNSTNINAHLLLYPVLPWYQCFYTRSVSCVLLICHAVLNNTLKKPVFTQIIFEK